MVDMDATPVKEKCEECVWWEDNGDGTQRICDCLVIYSPQPRVSFPDDEDDENRKEIFPDDDEDGDEEELKAVPWRELKQAIWYKVNGIIPVKTVNGPAIILKLQDRDSNIYRAWATNVIRLNIEEKLRERGNGTLFIKSKGVKKCKTSAKSYYEHVYKIVQ